MLRSGWGGGILGTKYPTAKTGKCRQHGQNKPSSISMTPYFKLAIWYMNGSFFFLIFQNWLKFKEIGKNKSGNFGQNRADWHMNGSLFLRKLLGGSRGMANDGE